MFLDGLLIITRLKDDPMRKESASHSSAIDLRSRVTYGVSFRSSLPQFTDDAIPFEFSIKQNLAAMFHVYVTSLNDYATSLRGERE